VPGVDQFIYRDQLALGAIGRCKGHMELEEVEGSLGQLERRACNVLIKLRDFY